MEKEFIPYEQALALKELGFDEPCISAYHTKEIMCIYSEIGYMNSDNNYLPTAPLYQQAFRWFRYNYKTMVFKFDTTMYSEWYFTIVDFKNDILKHSEKSYIDYEEAELECLKKLIEIVKK